MNQVLSVIMPAYNEAATIVRMLDKIKAVTLPGISMEIIIVNDCSQDDTEKLVYAYIDANPAENIRYCKHLKNMGKGAALHTGIKEAAGDFLLIQDADLEYDPKEYIVLLQPLLDGVADVVYGSRFMGGRPHRVLFFWHMIGNKFLTFLSNALTNLNLTDMETCYKVFKTSIIKNLTLKEKRFGFEPEVTCKVSRIKDIRLYEVGISYYGRTYSEGKKISAKDGFRTIYCLIRYGLLGL